MSKEDKTKKEDGVDLDPEKKPVREPEFTVHKMPKGYKTGRFDSVFSRKDEGSKEKKGFSVLAKKNEEEKKHHSRKTGLLVVFFGLIVVVFLIYFIISYIKNPDGDFLKMPSFNFFSKKELVVESLPILESEVGEENLGIDSTENESDIGVIENDFEEIEPIEEEESGGDKPEDDLNQELPPEDIGDDINNIPMIDSFSDTDSDGLSDAEEALLGSSLINIDTDGDGYDDLTELINLYDPVGSGPINANPNISEYSNSYFSYNIFYPNSWELKPLGDGSSVTFLISDNSFVQVLAEKNEGNKNINDWYFSRFFEVLGENSITDGDSWQGVYSPDFYSFYLTDKKRENVYSLVYSFPENTSPNYYNIFRMMVNSFNIK